VCVIDAVVMGGARAKASTRQRIKFSVEPSKQDQSRNSGHINVTPVLGVLVLGVLVLSVRTTFRSTKGTVLTCDRPGAVTHLLAQVDTHLADP
jgi:hypothetical protein